jgi:hypothetical protein
MTQREANLLWLKDTVDHLRGCEQQLEWAENGESAHFLIETMLRDLDRCRRLCEALHERACLQHAI